MKILTNKPVFVAAIFLVLQFAGCTEYWLTRGQPPSVAELMARSQKKLTDSRSKTGQNRADLGAISEQIELSLQQAVHLVRSQAPASQVAEQLSVAEQSFIQLDTLVSYGSRAPLGELSGQLRAMNSSVTIGVLPEYKRIGLFTARTLSFLANEMVMPAPKA